MSSPVRPKVISTPTREIKTPRGKSTNSNATASSALKSSGLKQKSLLNFFTKSAQKPLINEDGEIKAEISSSPIKKPDLAHRLPDMLSSPLAAKLTLTADTTLSNQPSSPIQPNFDTSATHFAPSQGPATDDDEDIIPSRKISNEESSSGRRARKRINYIESDDESEDNSNVGFKSKKVSSMVDDSEDEYCPVKQELEQDEDEIFDDKMVLDTPSDEEEEQVKNEPKPSPRKRSAQKESSLNRFNSNSTYHSSTTPKSSPFSTSTRPKSPIKKSFEKENEERYSWLVQVRDADGKLETDPEYDPRTLFIPKSAWAKFTAFEKQYWEVKSKMWNTVVFFKKGKFYELYERDADIAHSQFDLKLAGGGRANMRLAGIPEMSFDFWAASFIAKGHNVARVDQKETALAKEMRENNNGGKKEDKVIRRELACVLTSATLTDESMLTDDLATYCMAIKMVESYNDPVRFAVCFVDTATAAFHVSEFTDDTEYTKFETLIAQIRPRELLLEKSKITKQAVRIIKNNTGPNTLWNYLNSGTEFWDADTAAEECARGEYFKAANLDDTTHYPEVLKHVMASQPATMSAFGAMLWYLKYLKIDGNLISLGNFSVYDSIKRASSLVLDGQSLQNLEIFANTFDGSEQGTVFKLLNRCITPFGKRLLRNWVCHPLVHADKINARLDAVDLLNSNYELQETIESKIAKLPDLERLLSRIHAGQIKVKDFVRVIEGFECIYELLVQIRSRNLELKGLLLQLVESFPNLEQLLSQWSEAFDRLKAKDEGVLIPESGVDAEFDNSIQTMSDIEAELHVLLAAYKKEYKSHEICFRDSGKEVFLIEMPVRIKSVPKTWQIMSSTVKVRRYWSPEVRGLVRSLLEARESHKLIAERITGHIFAKFDTDYESWVKAVHVVANIDCLLSLARTSAALGSTSCRPNFIDDDRSPTTARSELNFEELRHPCFNSKSMEFIPNDVALGGDRASLALLTGANAAGKSTVLRMTCVAVIMAQIGCYVPSRSARLTPVDRIMTRLGANDNIFAGKSTFYVELSETKRILSEATNRSLIVLDELGRGGSTSDGFAIAEAVLHHLATYVGSLGFFATHYGTLWSSFKAHPEVEPKRMAILVDDASKRVTFLYKLEPGTSPGSFGMHVATMCGISPQIVAKADIAAQSFEHTARMKKQLDMANMESNIPLGLVSDFSWLVNGGLKKVDEIEKSRVIGTILEMARSC